MVREFLQTSGGKVVGIGFVVVAVIAAFFAIRSFAGNDLDAFTAGQVYICSETLKEFKYTPKLGDPYPAKSPHSGKNTGYPAERCFWTKDGRPKSEPTYVLVNAVVGKPGPTFCHDCGRLVIAHNPYPQAGMKAPPTPSEYKPGRTPIEE